MAPNLPLISYHGGHTGDLCAHAEDTKEAIIQTYIAKGFSQFALTEHVPPPDDTLLYADEIARGQTASSMAKQFDDYFFSAVPQLKQHYSNQAEILFGFETEFHSKDPLRRVSELIARYNPDIVVASVHHVKNLAYDIKKTEFDESVKALGGIEAFYQCYFDHQLDLVKHLQQTAPTTPFVVGHIDLPKIFAGPIPETASYWSLLERNIDYFAAESIPIEINTHAFKRNLGEPYPSEAIIKCIAKRGGIVTLGDDSHRVSEVGHYWKETAEIIGRYFNSIAKLNFQTRVWHNVAL